MDCSLPGSFVHGIIQKEYEWVAISYLRGSSHPGIEPTSFASIASIALGGGFLTLVPPVKPKGIPDHHSDPQRLWAGHLTSLSSSFLVYKMGGTTALLIRDAVKSGLHVVAPRRWLSARETNASSMTMTVTMKLTFVTFGDFGDTSGMPFSLLSSNTTVHHQKFTLQEVEINREDVWYEKWKESSKSGEIISRLCSYYRKCPPSSPLPSFPDKFSGNQAGRAQATSPRSQDLEVRVRSAGNTCVSLYAPVPSAHGLFKPHLTFDKYLLMPELGITLGARDRRERSTGPESQVTWV